MRIFIGTSGYSYAPWRGRFYPPKLPAAKMLEHYASRLPSVELNVTFYRMPEADAFTKWASEVPDGFRFAVKSPKRITHDKRLTDTTEALPLFVDTVATLGAKLGPLLFQLPPFQKKDRPRLAEFLAALRTLAPTMHAAFEFRHVSWFDDEIFTTLKEGGAALCIAEDEKLETPFVATAPWGYLRLRKPDYDMKALVAWTKRVKKQAWEEAFVFFKHEETGKGPRFAEAMRAGWP